MKNVLMVTALLLTGSVSFAQEASVVCVVNEYNKITQKSKVTFVDLYEADRVNDKSIAMQVFEVKTAKAKFNIVLDPASKFLAIRGFVGANAEFESATSSLGGDKSTFLEVNYKGLKTAITCN